MVSTFHNNEFWWCIHSTLLKISWEKATVTVCNTLVLSSSSQKSRSGTNKERVVLLSRLANWASCLSHNVIRLLNIFHRAIC